MLKWVTTSILGITSLLRAQIPITDQYDNALEMAQAYQKPLVLLFTGSGWSEKSEDCVENIKSRMEEDKSLRKGAIYVQLDFPEVNHQPLEKIQRNFSLQKAHDIQDFPTLVLLSDQQEEMVKLGWESQTLHRLQELIANFHQLRFFRDHLDDLEEGELEILYQKSSELHLDSFGKEVLKSAIETERSVKLMLEGYARLVTRGEEDPQLRSQLLALDPTNRLGVHRRIALLDYEHAKCAFEDAECAVHPLLDYLAKFPDDPENWRVHLIIAEKYNASEEFSKAQMHAEKAKKTAPLITKNQLDRFMNLSN